MKKITTLPAWRKADPYTEQAELAAVNTLIELVAGYCRAAVIERWSVRCISPFRQASDLGRNRSWAEPVKPERTIHQAARLHLAKEELRMRRHRPRD